MSRTIGVVGGMGPWSTLDFFEKVLRLTPARRDQEHLRLIIDSNPQIPDRTLAVLGGGEDPTPLLVATARNVEAAGADLIAIPCNTAHAFFPAIQEAVHVPVLHIMVEVARATAERLPGVTRVGVLATSGTVAADLYQRAFRTAGVTVLVPDEAGQRSIDRMISAIKAQRVEESLRQEAAEVGRRLVQAGAAAMVLGCTELPLVLGEADLGVPALDSNLILAQAAVRMATSEEALVSPLARPPVLG